MRRREGPMNHLKNFAFAAIIVSGIEGSTVAQADMVVNGGFETGDFAGWTVTHAAQGSGVIVLGEPHSGSFAAGFLAVTPPYTDTISQTLSTTPGGTYILDYWLENGAGPLNLFQASWDGTVIPGS